MGRFVHINTSIVMALVISSLLPTRISTDTLARSRFIYWNVGQGDLMTLVTPRLCWFFDLGGSKDLSKPNLLWLKKNCHRKRTEAFLSHFDKDHIRNYRQVDSLVPLQTVYLPHLKPSTSSATRMLNYFKMKGVNLKEMRGERTLISEGVVLKCLWPKTKILKNENDGSLVFELKYHHQKILLTGDLPHKREKELNISPLATLKVAHHGSGSSSEKEFLQKLRPHLCVISVGKDNRYGHPHPKLLKRLRESPCAVVRTDRHGTLSQEL